MLSSVVYVKLAFLFIGISVLTFNHFPPVIELLKYISPGPITCNSFPMLLPSSSKALEIVILFLISNVLPPALVKINLLIFVLLAVLPPSIFMLVSEGNNINLSSPTCMLPSFFIKRESVRECTKENVPAILFSTS